MSLATIFTLLLLAHFLADYPLQGDFLAKAKNRTAPIPGVPWQQALGAHAAIHGGLVGAILNPLFGLLEFAAHWVIDDLKCRGKLSFNLDQTLHVACKVLWLVLWSAFA